MFLVVLLGIGASGVALWRTATSEPSYEGRRLSSWIEDYYSREPKEKRERALAAVQHVGTNALPFLMEELCATDSRTRTRLYDLAIKQHFINVPLWPGYLKRQRARVGFKMLGATVKPVVPELISLLEDTNRSIYVRYEAATVLGTIGPDAKAATPVLLRLLRENNPYMRSHAASSLGSIGDDAELAIPALVENLAYTNAGVRYQAAVSIGKFGTRATLALPALYKAEKDPDRDVRDGAQLGIQMIERPDIWTRERWSR